MSIPNAPELTSAVRTWVSGVTDRITMIWVDNSSDETNFVVQYANDVGFTTGFGQVIKAADSTTHAFFADNTHQYWVRVCARNADGDSAWSVIGPINNLLPTIRYFRNVALGQ